MTCYSWSVSAYLQTESTIIREIKMKFSICAIVIFFSIMLSACASPDHKSRFYPTIDRSQLIISMSYTQRQLLNILLNPLDNTQSKHKLQRQRHKLLLSSHCDLIRRNIVHTPVNYPACHTVKQSNRFCINDFHHCIAKCPSFKRDCPPCEKQALQCLTESP